MRHLLIIILSILLLSSPLFGQETGVLFFSFENGEFVYSEEGDDDNVGKYEGEIENGKPNGQGTFTYGKGKGDKYVGEFKGGYKNGQGTYTWSDGDKYVGKFKDDKPNGQGTYTWSDGDKYVGEFKDGKKHGQGTWTSTDGEKYSGEWKVGKKYGQGTLIYPEKDKFLGEFKGKPWNGKWYDKDGNILYKLVYGESVR